MYIQSCMMNKKKIRLSSPHMSGKEQKYIEKAFNENTIAPFGNNIDWFEKLLGDYLGNKHVVALNSGTSALHLALKLANVSNRDVVICQSNTYVASVNPIIYQNAIPVFVDSESETWNMSPELLEQAIRSLIKTGQKPKAIIVVHLYGMPAKMKEITSIAQHYGIKLIEDAAESLGSSVEGKLTGTLGDYGILSFNANKIITTSAGGALITRTSAEREKVLFWATQSRENLPWYEHNETGYNYRMSNVLAGIGCGQMEVLPLRIEQRRRNFEFYKQNLKTLPIQVLPIELKGVFSNRWLTTILTESYEIREKIRLHLMKENIETRPLWKPMHRQPLFEKAKAFVNGVSDNLFERGLCLPSGSNLSIDDKERIVRLIKSVF